MLATLIGIAGGLSTISLFLLLKQFDKKLMYGLILCGIGFLYVGFAWSDPQALLINAVQAVCFVFFAYFGITKSLKLLAVGYFFHGIWDLVYHMFQDSSLIPPHYDLFCMSIDFTIGLYILLLNKSRSKMSSLNQQIATS